MDCSPPGSSVHGILPVRILEGLPFPTPRDLPNPGMEPVSLASPALAGGCFITVLHGKPRQLQELPTSYDKLLLCVICQSLLPRLANKSPAWLCTLLFQTTLSPLPCPTQADINSYGEKSNVSMRNFFVTMLMIPYLFIAFYSC